MTSPSVTEPAGYAVLFDVGYTLLDESARLRAALDWLAAELASVGVLPADLHDRYVTTCAAPDAGSPSLFVQMMMQMGMSADEARELRRRMQWDAVGMTPYPDAAEALTRLRQAGLRLGVLANQPVSAQDDLQRAGLLPWLDDVWLSDAVGLMKPDPAFFRLALDAWGVPPDRVAYVGDRPDNDVRPAKALGLHTVLLRVGPHAHQPIRGDDETPDFVAQSLAEAAEHLAAWGRRGEA